MDTLREILVDVNADINHIMKHVGNNYFRNFMNTAYLKSHKLPLPEGDPPYTASKIESEIQTKGIMWQFLKKLDTLRNPKLHRLKCEVMFIDALENVTETEAKILISMKDQTLHLMFANITLTALMEVGYFPAPFCE